MGFVKMLKSKTNLIVTFYIAVVVAYQALWLIAPIRAFLFDSNLNKISSALALLGLLLCIWDLFTERFLFKGEHVFFLIATLCILTISSIVYFRYGVINNIKVIIWQAVQMLLIYTFYNRISKEKALKFLQYLHGIISVILLSAVFVSIYQFIVYNGYNILVDGGVCKQGFQEGRLFGIFGSVYFTSIFSLIMMVASVYFAVVSSKIYLKVLYVFESIVFFVYVVLSQTRSVEIASLMGAFVLVFILSYRWLLSRPKPLKKVVIIIICVAVSLCAALIVELLYMSTEKVFQLIQSAVHVENGDNSTVVQELIQERPDVNNSDISNNRFKIWKDYIYVFSQKILSLVVGITPGNYMKIIQDRFSDIYIVEYIRNEYPVMFEKNLIYDTHNSYLSIFVTSGILGALTMITFFAHCFLDCIKNVFKYKNISKSFAFLITIILVIMVAAFFDSDLFFKCTSTSVVFWLLAGFTMKLANNEETSKKCLLKF